MKCLAITTDQSASQQSDMLRFAQLFQPQEEWIGRVTAVGSADLPQAQSQLLDHPDHMTVAHQQWHGAPVLVEVLDEQSTETCYARHSLLRRSSDRSIVQSGIMRIDTESLPEQVTAAIHDGQVPLGRLLIEAGLLRQVELLALWQIEVGPRLAAELELNEGDTVYGRTARILVDHRPVVEVLEIVVP